MEALNWANRLLMVVTCDDRRALLRALPLVAATTLLKSAELLVSVPRAVPDAFRRLVSGLGAARGRRRELLARARRDPGAVVAAWVVPFRFGPWVRAWLLRITGRSPGVDD